MYVILALLLLGVLIIAHEAGHFWAARACGISVQEFSMGMGPRRGRQYLSSRRYYAAQRSRSHSHDGSKR